MPYLNLSNGQTVLLDDEDYEWACQYTWYVRARQDRSPKIIHDEIVANRVFRVFLHRAVALRMHPELEEIIKAIRVKCKNGDYTDVRRTNLEVTVSKTHACGRYSAKPLGSAIRRPGTAKRPEFQQPIALHHIPRTASPLWAGGFHYERTRLATLDGSKSYAWHFAGRVVVGENGPCRGGFRFGDGRHLIHHRASEWRGKKEADLYIQRENEGGGVLPRLGRSSEKDGHRKGRARSAEHRAAEGRDARSDAGDHGSGGGGEDRTPQAGPTDQG